MAAAATETCSSIEAIRDSLLLDKDNLTKIYDKAMKHWNELVHQKVNKKF